MALKRVKDLTEQTTLNNTDSMLVDSTAGTKRTTLSTIVAFVQSALNSVFAKPSDITKAKVGLNNVTNDAQVKRSEMGIANGVATLGSDGKIPSSQLPSYVDDVLEYANKSSFPATGEDGKIYVDESNNKTYRWGGSNYVEISASLALGETSSTAYAGDKGKANAQAIAALQVAVEELDTSFGQSNHSHSNKSILDATTASFTTGLKGSYDAAYTHSQEAHAPSNAEKNIIVEIQKNGTKVTPDSNRKVNITVPTKTSELTNDSNFATQTDISDVEMIVSSLAQRVTDLEDKSSGVTHDSIKIGDTTLNETQLTNLLALLDADIITAG